MDVLVLRAAAQQKDVRALQDLEERNFGPLRIPPQRVLVAIGRDEDLFASADPIFDQHIRGKLRHGRDPAGSPADQRQQCAIGQAEGAGITFRFDERVRIMNAYDVTSRQHRTEISKAQDAGCPIPRQNQLVPGMTRTELSLANIDLRKRKFYVRAGRHSEPQSKPPRDVAVFRGYFVKRGNDFIRIALNAGDPLGHEPAVDGPDRPSVNAVVRAFHN